MLGVEQRAKLLTSFGRSLLGYTEIFGAEGRPGKIIGIPYYSFSSSILKHSTDYMLARTPSSSTLDVLAFWDILQRL